MPKKASKPTPKIGLFDILKNITIEKVDRWDEIENEYNAFMVNKFLSMSATTVLYANEMNSRNLTDREQYYFYLYTLPKRNVYFKWEAKFKPNDDMELIMKHFGINTDRAQEYMEFLNSEDINTIENYYTLGGVTKKTK